ncbi:MAG: hopanoid biosynthesis-associated protein HpnK [Verrucomicrobiia bacterium]|jgi:hopanoid biosynthesis associated protein HpnK
METKIRHRRLIVNADDFGKDAQTNAAVEKAHREGILTSASLMVNEETTDDAVKIARANPELAVGLHLTLLFDKPALSMDVIPDLIDPQTRRLRRTPVRSGFNYYFKRRIKSQLEAEISAQINRYKSTGLRLDHLNGHLHFTQHPVVFNIILSNARSWGITAMRLMREPLLLNLRIARGRLLARIAEAFTFACLSKWCENKLKSSGIKYTDRVFGLLQNRNVDSDYLINLLERLPAGVSEIYSHPSLDTFRHELSALLNPRAHKIICEREIKLITYQQI